MASAQVWLALQFDAAIQSASEAQHAWASDDAQRASAHAWRAASVVQSLQHTLDMRRGGELARNLFELFDYLQRRLRSVADVEPATACHEVADLLTQVRQAWQAEPELVPTYVAIHAPQVH